MPKHHKNAQFRKFLRSRGWPSTPIEPSKPTESKLSDSSRYGFFNPLSSLKKYFSPALLLMIVKGALANSEYVFQGSDGKKVKMVDKDSRNWMDFITHDVLGACNVSLASLCDEGAKVVKEVCMVQYSQDYGDSTVRFKECLDTPVEKLSSEAVDCISHLVDQECRKAATSELLSTGLPFLAGIAGAFALCCGATYLKRKYCPSSDHNSSDTPSEEKSSSSYQQI